MVERREVARERQHGDRARARPAAALQVHDAQEGRREEAVPLEAVAHDDRVGALGDRHEHLGHPRVEPPLGAHRLLVRAPRVDAAHAAGAQVVAVLRAAAHAEAHRVGDRARRAEQVDDEAGLGHLEGVEQLAD